MNVHGLFWKHGQELGGSRMGKGSNPIHSVASGRCLGNWGTVGDRVEHALGLLPTSPNPTR